QRRGRAAGAPVRPDRRSARPGRPGLAGQGPGHTKARHPRREVSALPALLRGAPTIGVPALLDADLAGFYARAVQLSPLPRQAGIEDNTGGLLRRARWPPRDRGIHLTKWVRGCE